MVKYKCELCNFSSKYKNDLSRHINTKKHANNLREYGLEKQKNLNIPQKTTKNHQNRGFLPQKTTKNHNNFEFICIHCNKTYTRQDALTRHIKKSCKEYKKKNSEKILLLQLEESKKEKQKLYDYIDKLIERTGDTFNIDNTTHNTQNNQITLNSFGDEDISHITDKFMQKIINLPFGCVQKMIERVHFSKKKPENNNIALTNKKENMVKVYKNKKWKYKNREEIMEELIIIPE